jgi:peptidoglycan/LPS O-acetylase OafA/YrhL
LRLLPALGAALMAYATIQAVGLVCAMLGMPLAMTVNPSGTREAVLVGVFFVTNIVQAQANGPVALGHLWSLATEEQFYLLWPPILVWLLARRLSPSALTRLLTGAIAVLAVVRPLEVAVGVTGYHYYYSPELSFDALLAGCLAGVWFVHRKEPWFLRSSIARRAVVPVALALLVVALLDRLPANPLGLVHSVAFELAAAVILFVVATDARSILARCLAVRPLVGLGRISYGLYVWHPIVMWSTHYLSTTEGVFASVAVAVLSHRFVERPFLRLKPAPAYATAASPSSCFASAKKSEIGSTLGPSVRLRQPSVISTSTSTGASPG